VYAVVFCVLIKSAFVGKKKALNLPKCTVKQQLKRPRVNFISENLVAIHNVGEDL
jgi:hypothetical protein